MKKLFFLIGLAMVCAAQASAESVSEQKALEIAQRFFSKKKTSVKSVSSSDQDLQLAQRSASYYAFSRGEADGYVIVAAEDAYFSDEVLGYSDSGEFDVDNMPAAMRWWLGEYDRALAQAKNNGVSIRSVRSRATFTNVAPLLSSKWGQDAPYNDKCPIVGGVKAPTGCVATALSQLLYHNAYPAVGYNGHTYDYDAMTDTYSSVSPQTAKDAVAELMNDVGLACNMNYGASVSGALNIDGARAMVNHFGYDKSAILLSRDFYSTEEWTAMLHSSLAAGTPLFYAGLNGSAAHAFVCDGYQDGYFHFNWGWEGISDGYFLIDALNPKDQGTGGSSSGYNLQQEALFNLKPAEADSDYETLMYCYSDFDATAKKQTTASTVTFIGSFLNYSLVPKDVTLGLKVVSGEGAVSWLEGDYTASLDTYAGPKQFSASMAGFPKTEGQYTVTPAYRDNVTGIWHEMRVNMTVGKTQLFAIVKGNDITLLNASSTGKPQLDFSAWTPEPSPLVAGKACSMRVDVKNSGVDYVGEMRLVMQNYETGQTSATSQPVTMSIAAGSTATVTFEMTAPAVEGMYKCFVLDSGDEQLNSVPPYVSVTKNTDVVEGLALKLSEVIIANENNFSIANPKITIKVTCESASYNGQVKMTVTQGTRTICYKTKNIAFASSGLTKSIDYSGTAFYGLKENQTYEVSFAYYQDGKWLSLGESRSFTTESATGVEELQGDNASAVTSIYSLSGVLVRRLEAGEQLDTALLPKGIYIMVSGCTSKRIVVGN